MFYPHRGLLHWRRGFRGFPRGFQEFRQKFRGGFRQGFIIAMPGRGGSGKTDATSGAICGSGMASVI